MLGLSFWTWVVLAVVVGYASHFPINSVLGHLKGLRPILTPWWSKLQQDVQDKIGSANKQP